MKRIGVSLLILTMFAIPVHAADFLEKKAVQLGQGASDFELQDLAGKTHKLSDYKGSVIMIHFWSAQCPFVIRYDQALKDITTDYTSKGVVVLGIDSNSSETPEQIKKVAGERKINYPILLDPGNKIADQFGAITTPHIYVLDKEGKLTYEGAVDDQGWNEETTPKTFYVRDAIDQTLKGETVTTPKTKSVGCTVKRAF